jgi:hypothetical protein
MTVTGTRTIRAVDVFGKFLLCWFGFSTLIYFWSGRLFTELESIPMSVRSGSYWWAVHAIFGVFGGAVAIFVMVPFLLRGHWLGLLIAFLYWVIGYVLNPFWYLFPQEWQGSEREGPTVFLYVINILWWLIILIGTVAFYFTRRSAKYLALTPNQRA